MEENDQHPVCDKGGRASWLFRTGEVEKKIHMPLTKIAP
jgi:hypothetical protein